MWPSKSGSCFSKLVFNDVDVSRSFWSKATREDGRLMDDFENESCKMSLFSFNTNYKETDCTFDGNSIFYFARYLDRAMFLKILLRRVRSGGVRGFEIQHNTPYKNIVQSRFFCRVVLSNLPDIFGDFIHNFDTLCLLNKAFSILYLRKGSLLRVGICVLCVPGSQKQLFGWK